MSEPQQTPGHDPAHAPAPQPGQPYAQPAQPYAQPGQPYSQPGQPYGRPPQGHPQQPGQPCGSPQAPYGAAAHPYGTPGQPPVAGIAARSGSGLGRTAFLVAAISVAVGLLFQLITPFLYSGADFEVVGALSTIVGFLVLAGSVVALILGILALRRPAPHLLAAIAIGIAGSTVAGRIVAWAGNLFSYF